MDKELIKTIIYNIECLDIDLEKDDNKYHYDLAIGNLKDLMESNERPKK